MAVAELERPGSLGRVIGGAGDVLERIVEAADATPDAPAHRTVNAGLYALPAPAIFAYLARLEPNNAKGELYLTDALGAVVLRETRSPWWPSPIPARRPGSTTAASWPPPTGCCSTAGSASSRPPVLTILEPARTTIEPG